MTNLELGWYMGTQHIGYGSHNKINEVGLGKVLVEFKENWINLYNEINDQTKFFITVLNMGYKKCGENILGTLERKYGKGTTLSVVDSKLELFTIIFRGDGIYHIFSIVKGCERVIYEYISYNKNNYIIDFYKLQYDKIKNNLYFKEKEKLNEIKGYIDDTYIPSIVESRQNLNNLNNFKKLLNNMELINNNSFKDNKNLINNSYENVFKDCELDDNKSSNDEENIKVIKNNLNEKINIGDKDISNYGENLVFKDGFLYTTFKNSKIKYGRGSLIGNYLLKQVFMKLLHSQKIEGRDLTVYEYIEECLKTVGIRDMAFKENKTELREEGVNKE